MANIALCTDEKTHDAFTNTKAMLEELGHIVSGYGSGEMITSQLATFDIILCARMSTVASDINAVVGAVDRGVPVITGAISGGTENSISSAGVSIATGIALSQNTKAPTITGFYPTKSHSIFLDNKVEINALCRTSGATYCNTISLIQLATGGNIIGNYANTLESDAVIAIYNRGATVFNSKILGADVIFCGFLYGLAGYTQIGAGLINSLIQISTLKRFIRGNVRDSANLPASRKLVAINRTGSNFEGSAYSDLLTGDFEIKVGEDIVYTVICYDEDGGTKNALIKDRVISVLD